MALTIACMFVPIIPSLFVTGYGYQIMHRLIVEHGDLYLPEWDDWNKLFKDGWRLFCVSFVYTLPASISMIIGMGLYFGAFIVMAMAGDLSNDPAASMMIFGAMGIFFLSIALTMILIIAAWCFLPVAMGHTVARDSFSAAFDFDGWWKVLKANLGGFFLAIVVLTGLLGVVYMIAQIFYMTIVLMCMMFIIPLAFGFYMMLVGFALIGLAYREGVEKLTPAPVVVVEKAPVVEVEAAGKTSEEGGINLQVFVGWVERAYRTRVHS